MLAGLWMLAGLFADGWAHLNLASTQESFFTPSHGVLYSGFAVAVAVVSRPVWGTRPSRWREELSAGRDAGIVGVVLFGMGGATDLLWHETLGVEVSVEALLSPTHLLLLVGGLLVLTVPLVTAWVDSDIGIGWRELAPALLATSLALAVVAFFTAYAWGPLDVVPLQDIPPAALDEQAPGHLQAERLLTSGLLARLLTTVILVGPLAALARRWDLPTGTATLLLGPAALGMAVLFSGTDLPVLLPTVGTFVGAAVGDLAIALGRPGPRRPLAVVGLSAVLPAGLWSANLVALELSGGVTWSPALWGGVLGLTTLLGAGIGGLAHAPAPRGVPREQA